MKNLYKHFNKIEVDMDEFEEMEVSEFEKVKLKQSILSNISPSKSKMWKKPLLASAMAAGLATSALVGLSFTANATELPWIGGIYRYFQDFTNNNFYLEYEESLNSIQQTIESNGIKVTVDDAVYDGDALSVTYTIETNKYMGESLFIASVPSIENNENNGSHNIVRTEGNKYIGIATTPIDLPAESINVEWNIKSIIPNLTTEESTKGNWNFAFSLDKTEAIEVLPVGQQVTKEGVTVSVDKITIAPNSFLVNYSHTVSQELKAIPLHVIVSMEVTDDLGNKYATTDEVGYGSSTWETNWSSVLEKLHPSASELTMKLFVVLTNKSTGETYKEFEMDTVDVKLK